jgi:hypothetical protein
MILTLDTLGERYGRLPSEVLAQGSTLDIYIMDAALTYRDYQQKKSQGQYAGDHTVEELKKMMSTTKRK